jgi:enoyl-[acyl-carrier protein] reductase I
MEMQPAAPASLNLAGKRGLIFGIANAHSIAAACARAVVAQGAKIACTYLNDKALPHVRDVTDPLGCELLFPCDVETPGQMEHAFAEAYLGLGGLDFVLHAIAFAPAADLQGRVLDCSAKGFALAMDVSCHSFLRMARLAEPLMSAGGCLLTVTFFGSERVVPHYGLMGPVKAALESAVRYAAVELAPSAIRVNALSPGAVATRAAGGIAHFEELLASEAAGPMRQMISTDDVGALAAFLVGYGARHITGVIIPIDGGQHLTG